MSSDFLKEVAKHALRAAFVGTGTLTMYATWKARRDPVHLFWDLDHTILCSISPIPGASGDGAKTSLLSPPKLQHFDQIDDDFPYDPETLLPNTRTYWRPGARMALRACKYFCVLHVYTAAQGTYTRNIVDQLDRAGLPHRAGRRSLFDSITHRDDLPEITKRGKDLAWRTDRLDRALLFDDRSYNFAPQKYRNGVLVSPFDAGRVHCLLPCERWTAYGNELCQMIRLVGIAFLGLLVRDVREVATWVRSKEDAMLDEE